MPAPTEQPEGSGEVTRLLAGLRAGNQGDREELFALVYGELKRIARRRMARVSPGGTLQPTMLVHEATLRLLGREAEARDRGHFLALAARAMRDVVVEQARRHAALKRGGAHRRSTLSAELVGRADEVIDVLVVHDALEAFARVDPQGARVVELRAFGGLGIEEIALELGWSPSAVDRRLAYSRAWLARKLAEPDG